MGTWSHYRVADHVIKKFNKISNKSKDHEANHKSIKWTILLLFSVNYYLDNFTISTLKRNSFTFIFLLYGVLVHVNVSFSPDMYIY